MNKEIITKFEKIEEELKLFDLQHEGLPIWEIVRFGVFSKLNNTINKRKNIYSDKFSVRKKLLKIFFNFIKSFYQLKQITQADILVLNHPRRFDLDGKMYDIYTDTFVHNLQYSYVVFENMFQLEHHKNVFAKNLFYLDYPKIIARVYSNFYGVKLSTTLEKKVFKLEQVLLEEFNVDLNLRSYIIREVTRFKKLLIPFKRLLTIIDPKIIIEVVNYSRPNKVFNFLANQMNIPVIELQHGTMGPYHLGYSYPEFIKNKLKTFPNIIFVWGHFWKYQTRFPIDSGNVIVTGFPYLEKKMKNTNSGERKDILIISQPTISEKFILEIIELSKLLQNDSRTIYFKLHPSELENAQYVYREVYKLTNVKVIDINSISIYDLFNKCSIQIGVYSTALIEGIAFELKTIIIKLPGWEYFEKMQGMENFIFVNSVAELNMKSIFNKKDSNIYIDFWQNNAINNIISNLGKIIMEVKLR